jgi:iron complex transport system substrate-binding protein
VLGRAEWLKFMALLVDKEYTADSIFSAIEAEYVGLRDMVFRKLNWPSVMTGSNFRGTWYMPGGNSYLAHMLVDAGAQYYYANDSTRGSLPLNVESVLKNFYNAEVWLNCNFNSISELIAADGKHALFQSVATGRVYNFNKRQLPSGANDYWESAVVRPDWLLKDLIAILHPDLLPEYELMYHLPLKK